MTREKEKLQKQERMTGCANERDFDGEKINKTERQYHRIAFVRLYVI